MRHGNYSAIPITLIAAFFLMAAACCSPREEAERNKEVVEQVAAAIRAYDYDALDQYIVSDYKRHCQATPDAKVESLEEFKNLMRGFENAFPDAEMKLEFLVAEGDLVAIWGKYLGTHTGPMGDIPATGQKVDSDFGGVHRLVDGKIVETWVTWDNVTMLQQLGLFPTPEEMAAGSSPDTLESDP